MTNGGSSEYAASVKSILVRWSVVLAALVVLAFWAAWRMQAAAARFASNVSTASSTPGEQTEVAFWTCSMHPDVRLDEPGNCPKCGMSLIPQYAGSEFPGVVPTRAEHAANTPVPPDGPKRIYRCTMPECNDPGSDDPDSRCPVCGMKRELVVTDHREDVGDAEVALSERARRLAQLATEPVARRYLHKRIRTVGKVTYDETRYKMLSAWTGGRIDKLFADFTGMVVSKGDHLVEIYSPELVSAQAEVLRALRTADAMSPTAPESSRRQAHEMLASAVEKLTLLGITDEQIEALKRTGKEETHLVLYAPLGGTIVHKSAMEGMYVKTGDPLYEIADLTHVWLMLELYEADLPWIAPFQNVTVMAESLPGEAFRGQIVFVDPVVDKNTRTIKVRVNVENPERRLKPQMFVTAVIDVAVGEGGLAAAPTVQGAFACPMHPWERADTLEDCPICWMDMVPAASIPGRTNPRSPAEVLSVPRQAIMRTGERSLAYVETQPGVYRGVEVVIGPVALGEDGCQFYPILAGLSKGQHVVTRGTFVIDSQMQIAGKPSLFNVRGAGASSEPHHGDAHPPPHESNRATPASDGNAIMTAPNRG
jgi:Cu(I)/Ag(I) efflux system membrane fusion protein